MKRALCARTIFPHRLAPSAFRAFATFAGGLSATLEGAARGGAAACRLSVEFSVGNCGEVPSGAIYHAAALSAAAKARPNSSGLPSCRFQNKIASSKLSNSSGRIIHRAECPCFLSVAQRGQSSLPQSHGTADWNNTAFPQPKASRASGSLHTAKSLVLAML